MDAFVKHDLKIRRLRRFSQIGRKTMRLKKVVHSERSELADVLDELFASQDRLEKTVDKLIKTQQQSADYADSRRLKRQVDKKRKHRTKVIQPVK